MCDTKSCSSHKNLSFQTFLDCYQILTELRLFLGRFNLSQADRPHLHHLSSNYSDAQASDWLKPTGPSADTWRTVRSCIVDTSSVQPKLTGASGGPSAVHGRTARAIIFCWSEPLVKNYMNGGLSASYTRTVRATKFQTAQNLANFHNFNFELGLLLK